MLITDLIDKFVDSLTPEDRVLILTHDNPDPDSISSAVAMRHIIHLKSRKRAVIGYGGIIGRAENRSMCTELDIKLTPLSDLNIDDFDRIVLVDCQPEAGNSPVYHSKVPVSLSIDHHPKHTSEPNTDYLYLNDSLGATATILTYYFMDNQIEPPKSLATALFYGIKSETQSLSREAGKIDRDAFMWLFPRIDMPSLGRIENPRRRVEYFHILGRVVDRALVYDDAIVCNIGEISEPDLVPQVADLMLTLEGVQWSLCMGHVDDLFYVSIRTSNADNNSHKVIRKVIVKDGTSGGHGMMAGGRIEALGKSKTEIDQLEYGIKMRFLEAIKNTARRGKKLFHEKKSRRKTVMLTPQELTPRDAPEAREEA